MNVVYRHLRSGDNTATNAKQTETQRGTYVGPDKHKQV